MTAIENIDTLTSLEIHIDGAWQPLKASQKLRRWIQCDAGAQGRGSLMRDDNHGSHVVGPVRWNA